MTTLSAAIDLAGRGYAVFPCKAGAKIPATAHGFHDAQADVEAAKKWWGDNPAANIGVATGKPSGVVVIDVDQKNGKDGKASLAILEAELGSLPACPESSTPTGGRHLLFAHPGGDEIPCSRDKLGIGIDIRADGGYIVVPPSKIPDGDYSWVAGLDDAGLPEIPPAWLERIRNPPAAKPKQADPEKRAMAYLAKCPNAISGDGGHDATLRAAAECFRFGLDDAAAARCMNWWNANKCSPAWTDKELAHKIADAKAKVTADGKVGSRVTPSIVVTGTSWRSIWTSLNLTKTGSGVPHSNLDNAAKIIERHPHFANRLWFDVFLGRTLTTWNRAGDEDEREWTDDDDANLQLWFQREIGLAKMSLQTAHDAAQVVARSRPRNQLTDWLDSLKWDGTTDVSDTLVRGFGATDTPYHRQVGRCWMMSLVARAIQDRSKVDTMIVLEGPQGAGKSTGLSVLGGKWFIECHEEISGKDFYGVIAGRWLIEIAEMHAFSKSEIDRVKGIISNEVDRYRAPYARHAEDHPRRCVFAGTTNRNDWNEDPTGARRFWPVKCGKVDLPWLRRTRDQLFAHAAKLIRDGENWYTVDQEEAKRQQEMRRRADAWEPYVDAYLKRQIENGESFVTTADVLKSAIGTLAPHMGRQEQNRVSQAIRLAGWQIANKRIDGIQTKGWAAPQK